MTEPRQCHACRLYEGRTQVVMPDGAVGGILVVGEAPGAKEDAAGVGFCGAAGRNLDAVMAEHAGLARDEYARTNVVRCRPPDNRKPTAQEVSACAHWLDATISEYRPRVILAVGQSAADRLVDLSAEFSDMGVVRYLDYVEGLLDRGCHRQPSRLPHYGGVPVVCMPHTSPLAWNRRAVSGRAIREIGALCVSAARTIAGHQKEA